MVHPRRCHRTARHHRPSMATTTPTRNGEGRVGRTPRLALLALLPWVRAARVALAAEWA